jgi:hypothetical protein
MACYSANLTFFVFCVHLISKAKFMVFTAVLVVQNFRKVRLILLLHFCYPDFSKGYSLKLLDPEREGTMHFLTWVPVCLSLRSLETFIYLIVMTINFEALGLSAMSVTIYQSTRRSI